MITLALMKIRPNAQWTLHGDTYDVLEWLDKEQTKPSEQEINDAIVAIRAEAAAARYKKLRAVEYPSIGDQLDALWKGGEAAAEMLARIQAVKDKYPKGE